MYSELRDDVTLITQNGSNDGNERLFLLICEMTMKNEVDYRQNFSNEVLHHLQFLKDFHILKFNFIRLFKFKPIMDFSVDQ